MAVDRHKKNVEWYVADEEGRVYDAQNAAVAVLMDIRRELRTVNQHLLSLRLTANDIRAFVRPRPRRRITAKQAARVLARRANKKRKSEES